jgi:hypothetical protein
MSFVTGTNVELIYASTAAGTAKASFTSEVAINDTAGMGAQAFLPAGFFLPGRIGQGLRIKASGILSSTATPTYTFTVRLGAAGSTTAAIVLGTAALTTQSGITNKKWTLEGDVLLRTNLTGANSTAYGDGWLTSPAGLASPFIYEAWGGAAQPGTVATVDPTITNYVNVNATCSASSSSNSIQLLSLEVWGKN